MKHSWIMFREEHRLITEEQFRSEGIQQFIVCDMAGRVRALWNALSAGAKGLHELEAAEEYRTKYRNDKYSALFKAEKMETV